MIIIVNIWSIIIVFDEESVFLYNCYGLENKNQEKTIKSNALE